MQNGVLSNITNKEIVTEFSKNLCEKSKKINKDDIISKSNFVTNTISTITNNYDDSFYKDDIEFIEILQKS